MSEQGKNGPEAWEQQINAFLDGELGPAEAEALKSDATEDQRLARAIIEAYQLQQAMEHLGTEAAPARLRRKLRRIPREQGRRPLLLQPRWAAAFAAVPLLVISLMLFRSEEPSRAEVEKAAAELALAFAYIDRVSDRTRGVIEHQVGGELQQAVGGSVMRSIPQPKPESKEIQA
jgi:anti-sigma factor RsiW